MSNVNPVTGVNDQINAHTEQALIELVYIQEANNLLGSALGNLDSALNASQSVLNLLQALQTLQNSISVKSPSAFPFSYSTGTSPLGPHPTTTSGGLSVNAYVSSYNAAASAYFGKPIDPTFVFSSAKDPGFKGYVSALTSLKTKLQDEFGVISTLTPASQRGAGSLYDNLKIVLNNLPSNFKFSTVEKWALDNLNQHSALASLAGNFENDLTSAITSAQSLNDTQKENVRKYLFIFQEYYQSASAVLSGLNQIIEQIAQKVSGS